MINNTRGKFYMNIKDILAIDVHSHYNTGNQHDTITSEIYQADLDYLKGMYDAAKIEKSCCSTFASVLSSETAFDENEHNYKKSQELVWLYQWVVIDPRADNTFEQAERMLQSLKCVGIKIHPACHGYSILDYAEKIFSFAADHNTVVLMHPDQTEEMPGFTNKYPDMSLIIAHLGSVEHVNAIKDSKHGNIYVDTSGAASTRNKIIEYAVEEAGSEKILFGTDTYASGFQRGRIEYAQISETDKENILRRNALRLFAKNLCNDA
jgi:uncharacterized protein